MRERGRRSKNLVWRAPQGPLIAAKMLQLDRYVQAIRIGQWSVIYTVYIRREGYDKVIDLFSRRGREFFPSFSRKRERNASLISDVINVSLCSLVLTQILWPPRSRRRGDVDTGRWTINREGYRLHDDQAKASYTLYVYNASTG